MDSKTHTHTHTLLCFLLILALLIDWQDIATEVPVNDRNGEHLTRLLGLREASMMYMYNIQ